MGYIMVNMAKLGQAPMLAVKVQTSFTLGLGTGILTNFNKKVNLLERLKLELDAK